MEYPKINSLWKRDESRKLIAGDYARPEFGNIRRWAVDEKIDGTNIRVYFWPSASKAFLEFKGRTDNAQIPHDLQKTLEGLFTYDKLAPIFADKAPHCVEFFGEGYGPKIQCGGYYAAQPSFCLFDIRINHWWLERGAVKDIAAKLGLNTPREIGIMAEPEIIEYVKSQPISGFAKIQPHVAEGVVCRSDPLMLFRDGTPIMWKLKCKEFV